MKTNEAIKKYCPHCQGKCKADGCMYWNKLVNVNDGECLLLKYYNLQVNPVITKEATNG